MLSINTNLSSLIAQGSMKSSTNKLNQAIERMTTGFKINHAKDNAANYSIATNMTTKIGAYDVAADNVASGMDLVTTAMDTIALMQDKAERLRALSTQARNGTYGAQSLEAINTEAAAIIAEINRLYSTSEYNGISLFDKTAYTIADHLPQAGESGFIDETAFIATASETDEYGDFIADPKTYTNTEVAAMTKVADVSTFTSGEKYSISSVEELQKLADYVNTGNDTTGVEFVLGADIDLSSISNWTPIGDYSTNTSYQFKGTFDGNGHVIKNLNINNETKDYQGLFGSCAESSEMKNISITDATVNGAAQVGVIAGATHGAIDNCYTTGIVCGVTNVGGLIGSSASITNSYSECVVEGTDYVGGLVGYIAYAGSIIENCHATGNVNAVSTFCGGLIGDASYGEIINSYSTGSISASSKVGGLAGRAHSVINSYATGNVTGSSQIGGLVGICNNTISNCYAAGTVNGTSQVGGVVGYTYSANINNSYATGNISGTSQIGGIVGYTFSSINNCYATGSVSGISQVGGLAGEIRQTTGTATISDCVSYSTVSGNDYNSTGSLIGCSVLTFNGTSYGTLSITNCEAISQDMNSIGGIYQYASSTYTLLSDYDMTDMLAEINNVVLNPTQTTLQIGMNSDSSCQLAFDTNFSFNISAIEVNISSDAALAAIDEFLSQLSEQETMLGAVQNRLESALDSIIINIDNLTSSLSTIRDADIAEVSATYIQQQILQQASATLLATANQNPSIALQLI